MKTPPLLPRSDGQRMLGIIASCAAAFTVFGLLQDAPGEILTGWARILTTRDALITDYFGIGGMGAAFVNSGLLTAIACGIYRLTRAPVSGASVASLFIVMGFGLFGKNVFNVWPLIMGVWLYGKVRQQPFSSHVDIAFFGCALSPIFSEVLFSTSLPIRISAPLALITSLLLGFILSPVAGQLFKAHSGFSLYNVGFTAGVLGTLIVALFKSYGFVPDPVMIWTSQSRGLLCGFVVALLLALTIAALMLDRQALSKFRSLIRLSGQAPTDVLARFGPGATLLNMGLCGLLGLAVVMLTGADLNGPTIAGILTIAGFGAFGKHPFNVAPIMAGVLLGSIAKPWAIQEPETILATLFGTTLAPIAGQFGWLWGLVAGFLHSSASRSVGFNHAGLNLYNNGFAAGLVAAVLVPVIVASRMAPTAPGDPPRSGEDP